MSIQICGAPCCWGVDDPKNPYLPPWTRVLEEAGKAGYSAIELVASTAIFRSMRSWSRTS